MYNEPFNINFGAAKATTQIELRAIPSGTVLASATTDASGGWYAAVNIDETLGILRYGYYRVSDNMLLSIGVFDPRTVPALAATLTIEQAAQLASIANRISTESTLKVLSDVPSGPQINIVRGYGFDFNITGIGVILPTDKIYLTVKDDHTKADALSIIQIERAAGLLRLNADAPTPPILSSDGLIQATNTATGIIRLYFSPAASALLAPTTATTALQYDVKLISADPAINPRMLQRGPVKVAPGITRALS